MCVTYEMHLVSASCENAVWFLYVCVLWLFLNTSWVCEYGIKSLILSLTATLKCYPFKYSMASHTLLLKYHSFRKLNILVNRNNCKIKVSLANGNVNVSLFLSHSGQWGEDKWRRGFFSEGKNLYTLYIYLFIDFGVSKISLFKKKSILLLEIIF